MEYSLTVLFCQQLLACFCLNPCSNGILSDIYMAEFVEWWEMS